MTLNAVWERVPLADADPAAAFASLRGRGRLLLADADGWMLAAGAARELRTDGPGRGFALARGLGAWDSEIAVAAPAGAPPLPWLLALACEDHAPAAGHWGAALPGARLWLPRRLLWSRPDGGWRLRAAGEGGSLEAEPPLLEPQSPAVWPPVAGGYEEMVEDAVGLIRDGVLRKVVLARAADLAGAFGEEEVLRRLLPLAAQGATVYAIDLDDGGLFLGATPELLLAASGDRVRTWALAGTCAGDADPAVAMARVAQLAASTKERKEHGVVVEHLVACLRPRCRPFAVPAAPAPRPAGPMTHLETVIDAELLQRDYLELACALHPTPAVCGLPVDGARHWLRRHEHLHRGLYAGALGWLSRDAARLCVPLRGAVLAADRGTARLFAGAGVVETSDPAAELAETELKMQVMRAALTGSAG